MFLIPDIKPASNPPSPVGFGYLISIKNNLVDYLAFSHVIAAVGEHRKDISPQGQLR